MNLGELKEKIKNMSDDLPVVIIVNDGAFNSEYPLTQTYFNSECFILTSEVEVKRFSDRLSDPVATRNQFDTNAKKRGVNEKITLIKEYRELTGCGLLEAKNYVYKLLGI